MIELSAKNSHYRKDIDGLRAVAVLSVILFHIGVPGLNGGYIGVDVFFVISGYLISQRIIYGRLDKNFRFKEFYVRRIRRLFPAMLSTCIATLIAGFFFLTPEMLIQLANHVVGSVLSFANIQFFLETGYWDTAAASKPLLHMWSLSVEEQFYLFWPLILVLILRTGGTRSFYIILAISVLSIITTSLATPSFKSAAFYLMPFRIYEFLFGALCVWADGIKWRNTRTVHIARNSLFLFGLAMILGSALLFNEEISFPGYWASIPAAGTAFIIVAQAPILSQRLLSNPASRYVGLISYSLYLVHWPVIVFANMLSIGHQSATEKTFLILVIFVLAIAQYHLIETPLRYPVGKRKRPFSAPGAFPRTTLTALGSAVLVVTIASIIHTKRGFPARYADDIRHIASLTGKEINLERSKRMRSLCENKRPESKICGSFEPDRPNILVVGDSHAVDGINVFKSAYPDANYFFNMISGCPLLLNFDDIVFSNKECPKLNSLRITNIEQSINKMDAIIISQRILNDRVDHMREAIEWLTKYDSKIIVLGAGPEFDAHLVPLIAEHGTIDGLNMKMHQHAKIDQFAAETELQRFVEEVGGTYIVKRPAFCNDDGVCRVILSDGMPLMYDGHHLSLSAAKELGAYIRRNYGELSFLFEKAK